MKKFLLVLISLISVITLSLADFNVLKLDTIPDRIDSLLNKDSSLDENNSTDQQTDEAIEIKRLNNNNNLYFSYTEDINAIKSELKASFESNAQISVPYVDKTLGEHNTKVYFKLGNKEEIKEISYNICPIEKKDIIKVEKLNNNIIIPYGSTNNEIEAEIKHSYCTNGEISVRNINNNLGNQEARVQITKDNMLYTENISYQVKDIVSPSIYKNSTSIITIPYGTSLSNVEALLRSKFDAEAIFKVKNVLDLSVGLHQAQIEFSVKENKRNEELNYEIIPNDSLIILSNPKYLLTEGSLEVSYTLTNKTGTTINRLLSPSLYLIAFSDYDSYVVASLLRESSLNLNNLANNKSTTVIFTFGINEIDLAFFMSDNIEATPILKATIGR